MPALSVVSLNMSYRNVSSRRDVSDLVDLLLDPMRYNPVVVISCSRDGLRIDPARLAERLGSSADVYALTSMGVAYDFDDLMPDDTSVYGGAIRSYSPDLAWTKDQRKSVLRLAYSDTEVASLLDQIVCDVEAMDIPAPAPAKKRTPVRPAVSQPVEGTVAVLLPPDGALVKLADGMARIDTSTLAPGIEPDRLFQIGQKVAGSVSDGIIDISGVVYTPADAVDQISAFHTFPVLVVDDKKVSIFPGLDIRYASAHASGTVIAVTAELAGRADGKGWRVHEAQPGSTVTPALPFIKGGAPWLDYPAEVPAPAVEEASPAVEPRDDARPPAAAAQEQPPADDVAAAMLTIQNALTTLQDTNTRLTAQLLEKECRKLLHRWPRFPPRPSAARSWNG